ncbi:hypothetical protein TUM20984_49910 [Mycobacterium antarcticum]|nr:hypothetical protein TUM20984_49910 [Mycolicibacterium sp. TUM20984]
MAAFTEFRAAREAWTAEHEGAVLAPYEVDGFCPIDANRFRKSDRATAGGDGIDAHAVSRCQVGHDGLIQRSEPS